MTTRARRPGQRRRVGRAVGFGSFGAPLLLVAVLSACGDDGSSAGAPDVTILPTSYVTLPVASTSSTEPGDSGSVPEGGTVAGTQDYTIRSGDALSGIASDFGVEINQICEVNNWDDCESHLLVPGDAIRIPPGARVPGTDDPDEEDSDDTTADGEDSAEREVASDVCSDGSDRGTYTIEAGDYPGAVAEKLDVTLGQLEVANEGNAAFRSFIEGTEIFLPCPDELNAETSEV